VERWKTTEEPTVQQWLSLMPLVAHRGWSETPPSPSGVDIRRIRDRDGYCPICALVEELVGRDNRVVTELDRRLSVSLAAMRLGANGAVALAGIMTAADNRGVKHRTALKRALGMLS
jgi:hypothetical protein